MNYPIVGGCDDMLPPLVPPHDATLPAKQPLASPSPPPHYRDLPGLLGTLAGEPAPLEAPAPFPLSSADILLGDPWDELAGLPPPLAPSSPSSAHGGRADTSSPHSWHSPTTVAQRPASPLSLGAPLQIRLPPVQEPALLPARGAAVPPIPMLPPSLAGDEQPEPQPQPQQQPMQLEQQQQQQQQPRASLPLQAPPMPELPPPPRRASAAAPKSAPKPVSAKGGSRSAAAARQQRRPGARSNSRATSCKVCGKVFSCPWSRNRHMNVHLDLRSHPCRYEGCEWVFREKHTLERHIQACHLKRRPHVCHNPGCEYASSGASNLRRHLRTCAFREGAPPNGRRARAAAAAKAKAAAAAAAAQQQLLKQELPPHEQARS